MTAGSWRAAVVSNWGLKGELTALLGRGHQGSLVQGAAYDASQEMAFEGPGVAYNCPACRPGSLQGLDRKGPTASSPLVLSNTMVCFLESRSPWHGFPSSAFLLSSGCNEVQ